MKYKILSLVLSLAYLPFSLYLTFLMLQKIGATELMWFLFWMLVPFAVIIGIISKIADWEED